MNNKGVRKILVEDKTATTGNSDGVKIKSRHTDWIVAHIAEEIAKSFIKFGIDNRKANLIFNETLKLTKLTEV